jgi:hypothetical protein
LPALLRQTKWVTERVDSLSENFFADIHAQSLTWGTSTLVTARKA